MRCLILAVLLLAAAPARAECPSSATMQARAEKFMLREPLPAMPGLSLADGACAQRELVAALVPRRGPVVGWKAGLTNEAVQRAFGVNHPVRGIHVLSLLRASHRPARRLLQCERKHGGVLLHVTRHALMRKPATRGLEHRPRIACLRRHRAQAAQTGGQ